MTQRLTHLCAAGLLALTTGCAGSYSLIRPNTINSYTPQAAAGPIDFGYQFDALRRVGGNKKYIKKESKLGYHVVAVRVKNNWDRELNFSRDLNLLYGERPILPVPGAVAAQDMKQGVVIYLLYALLNFRVGGTIDPRTGSITGSTFLPTGPFIAAGNMLGASGANSNMRKEFSAFDLTDRAIKPGETVYGIVCVREQSVAPMRLELRPNVAGGSAPAAAPAPAPAPTPPATNPTRGGE